MPERRRTVAESNSQRPGPRRFRRRLRARIDDLFFKNIYRGTPPWDIGRPQAEFVALAESGAIRGEVLDIGCGTGDIALHLASRGFLVCGVDFAPLAIKKAREKARQRGLDVEFIIDNALEPTQLTRAFDTVIDSGLFHTFGLDAPPFYVATLARLVRPGGCLFILCFSENQPGSFGPRRITQAEIRAAFRDGWIVREIRAARLQSNTTTGDAKSWLATVERLAP
jgi:2-polyprenyl-3-methyl-5-hydroxy-6-metoxy-1,4-benzoquinol methylase